MQLVAFRLGEQGGQALDAAAMVFGDPRAFVFVEEFILDEVNLPTPELPEFELGEVLKLGRSEQLSGGRRKQALLGDAMEAVIAAVFRDAGFVVAAEMVLRLWGDRIGQVETDARDAKSALQEHEQAKGHTPPRYEVVRREGPDHAPEFTVAVRLADGSEAQAKAASKRNAEQAAAQQMLDQLG